jgi:hypothetical protein
MRISNIHAEATIEVHGTTLKPGESIDRQRCELLLTTYPGVGACIGCGVLDGDDEAKLLVELLRTGNSKTTDQVASEPKTKAKPGTKPSKPESDSPPSS